MTRPPLPAGTPSHRATGDASTPAHQITLAASMRSPFATTPAASIASIGVSSSTSTPIRSSERRANAASFSGKPAQHARPGLDQQDMRGVWVDVAEVAGQGGVGELGECSGHLDAGRPGADQDKGQQPPAYRRVGTRFRLFEGEQQAAADQRRVVDRFEARRQPRPVVMAEIGVLRPGRQHQVIVALGCPKPGLDPACRGIDAGHLVEQYRGVPLMAQHGPDRLGDIGRRQRRGRDLVQQRLEQVVVVAVDHRHVDGRPRQPASGFEPAEAGADNDDARPGARPHASRISRLRRSRGTRSSRHRRTSVAPTT